MPPRPPIPPYPFKTGHDGSIYRRVACGCGGSRFERLSRPTESQREQSRAIGSSSCMVEVEGSFVETHVSVTTSRCPHCGARPGQLCRARRGSSAATHFYRKDLHYGRPRRP